MNNETEDLKLLDQAKQFLQKESYLETPAEADFDLHTMVYCYLVFLRRIDPSIAVNIVYFYYTDEISTWKE